MPSWDEIAKETLNAAQKLGDAGYFRSCASRAYYAAFSAVSFALRSYAPFDRGRETPPHYKLTDLLQEHMAASFSNRKLREIKSIVRRLYNERINADYRAGWSVDARSALQARQDARTICRELGVIHASGPG